MQKSNVCVCSSEPWQNVTGCVRVSSPGCDLTRAFLDLNLYYLIRLGLHVGPQDLVWTELRSLDHEDFSQYWDSTHFHTLFIIREHHIYRGLLA